MRKACSPFAMATTGAPILATAEPAAAQFYSAKLNAQAKTALEEYAVLRTSQVAELDARMAQLDSQEAAPKAAIRTRGNVQRDLAVVGVLKPKGVAETDKQLIALSDARFKTIAGEFFQTFAGRNGPQSFAVDAARRHGNIDHPRNKCLSCRAHPLPNR